MIILLSPSKSINPKPVADWMLGSQPNFLDQAQELVNSLNELGPKLAKILGVSDKITEENRQRFKNWQKVGKFPAAWSYRGEVYAGLAIEKMNKKVLARAQEQIFIVSGLYGLLRPQDLILPYRLEMSTRLEGGWGKNLYSFWGGQLSKHILDQKPNFILNCSSEEYFKSIRSYLPNSLEVITPKFLAHSPDGPKPKMAFAKYTRGLMARWAIEQNISSAGEIQKFNAEGYKYQNAFSDENEPVFLAAKDFSLKGRWNKQ